MKRIIFTIVSANYIPYAATLMQSIRLHHPSSRRVIVVADQKQEFPEIDLAAELLFCDDLDIPLIENMKLWYTVIEFNTAIKPFVFQYFMRPGTDDAICYLDPDIFVYRPLSEVFTALQRHSCVLTPHIMQPLQDGKHPSDLSIMKSGVYNFGFFAVRNNIETRALIQWWADRLFAHCRVDVAANMFTDQRWMDLAPCFVRKPFILRHPGYNVAYWNLAHRRITKRDGKYLVDGRALIFFHFSGIDPDKTEQFSKHQNRFPTVTGAVADLCVHYREMMLRNGWSRHKTIPYAYASFQDGRPIENAMRHWLTRNVDQQKIDPRKPLNIASDFFDEIDGEATEQGCRLTRFMYQFWLNRKDLRDTFNIFQAVGLDGYINWFLIDAGHQGVDGRTVAAARRLRTGGQTLSLAHPPPWEPIASTMRNGQAANVAEFLSGDIELTVAGNQSFVLPRQTALLWERRSDLQRFFKLDTPDSLYRFVAWAMTQGVVEQSIDVRLFSEQFTEQFCQLSDLTGYYHDVPITWGMLMTRNINEGRGFLTSDERFPVERIGRLAHGLWFAFVAPKLYGWPIKWTATVRSYFDELSSVYVDGLALNRAAVAIWEVHPVLKSAFPLNNSESCLAFICWLVMEGLPSLQLDIDDLDDRLRFFLAQRSPRVAGISYVVEMVYRLRPDLQSSYDLSNPKARTALNTWANEHLIDLYRHLAPKPAARPRTVEHITLALTGYWSGASGRGEDLHCSAAALDAVEFSDYCIVDLGTSKVLRADLTECKNPVQVQSNICHVNADTAVQDWILLRSMGVTAAHTIGWWAWELEWLPSYWRHAYSFYDEIWASTRFAENAFRRENVRPVKIVPMAVVAPNISKVARSRFGIDVATKLFLFMFDFRSYVTRKNPEAVIQAFRRAFPSGKEDATLLLKSIGASSAPDTWRALHESCKIDKRIRLVDTNLTRAEAFGLVAGADAFVSLHRSEGFGRGIAEAMLLNVPVILTDYSGTSDFADKECALMVDYDLIPVRDVDYPGVEGQRWADPDVTHAAQYMRHIYAEPDVTLVHKAKRRIEHLYNAHTVGNHMLAALKIGNRRLAHV